MKNRNSSIVFLYMKSKCANFAYALLKMPKTCLFSWKTDISRNLLFWCVDDLYTKMLAFENLCECGTVVYHRTTDVKVLSGRS